MSWVLEIDGECLEVKMVEVRTGLNQPPSVCLWTTKDHPELLPGDPARILKKTRDLLDFVVRTCPADLTSGLGDRCIVGGFEEPAPRDMGTSAVRIVQKQSGETLAAFINRCGLSGLLAEANGQDGDGDHLDLAFPVGSCAVVGRGEDAECRQQRLFGWLRQSNPTIIGRSRGMHAQQYRIRTFNPGTADPNWHILADGEWHLGVGPGETPTLVRKLRVADLEGAFEQLQNPAARQIKVDRVTGARGESLRFPILPTTIRVGKRDYFACRVRFRFHPETDAPEPNLNVFLELAESPRSVSPLKDVAGHSHVLLGTFQGWCDGDDRKRLLTVVPATADRVTEPELQPLTDWSVQPGADDPQSLVAAQLIPGFVRAEHSSFYARLKAGDLVLVSVTYGGVPLLLGSPQQKRKAFEKAGGAEVAVSATYVRVSALNEDGSTADTDLSLMQDGNIAIRAKVALAALDNVEVRADRLRVASDTALVAALEVGGDATLGKSVSVGKKLEVGGAAVAPVETGAGARGILKREMSLALGPAAGKLVGQLEKNAVQAANAARQRIEQRLGTLEKTIKQKLEQSVAPLISIVSRAAAEAEGKLKALERHAQGVVDEAAAKLGEQTSELVGEIHGRLDQITQKAQETGTRICAEVEQAATELKNSVTQPLKEMERKIASAGDTVGAEIRAGVERAKALEQEIADGVAGAEDRLREECEQTWGKLKANGDASLKQYAEKARQSYDETLSAAKHELEKDLEAAEQKVAEAQQQAKEAAKGVEEHLKQKAASLKEQKQKLEAAVQNEVRRAEEGVRSARGQIEGAAGNAFNELKDAADVTEQAIARAAVSVQKLAGVAEAELAGLEGRCEACIQEWQKAGKRAELALRKERDRLLAGLEVSGPAAEEAYTKIRDNVRAVYYGVEKDLQQRVDGLAREFREGGGLRQRLRDRLDAVHRRVSEGPEQWKDDAEAFVRACHPDVQAALAEARSLETDARSEIQKLAQEAADGVAQQLKGVLTKVQEKATSAAPSGDGLAGIVERANVAQLKAELARAEALLGNEVLRIRISVEAEADSFSAMVQESIQAFQTALASTVAFSQHFLAGTESSIAPASIRFAKNEAKIKSAVSECDRARKESMDASADIRKEAEDGMKKGEHSLLENMVQTPSLAKVKTVDASMTARNKLIAEVEEKAAAKVAGLRQAQASAGGNFTAATAALMAPMLSAIDVLSERLRGEGEKLEQDEAGLDRASDVFQQDGEKGLAGMAAEAERILVTTVQSASAIEARAEVAFEQASASMEEAVRGIEPQDVEIQDLAENEDKCAVLANAAVEKIRLLKEFSSG